MEVAKKKKLVIITDHTGTEVRILAHGIAIFAFFATDKRNQLGFLPSLQAHTD